MWNNKSFSATWVDFSVDDYTWTYLPIFYLDLIPKNCEQHEVNDSICLRTMRVVGDCVLIDLNLNQDIV